MRELFSLLEQGQKRALAFAAGSLAAALVALIFISLGALRGLERRGEEVRLLRRQFDLAERERAGRSEEVARWEEARRDLDKLRGERFYSEGGGVNEMRLSLQGIFSGAGLGFPEAKFDYSELAKERARKVTISFIFQGTYGRLKNFLAAVEREDRFLFVEHVVFQNIDPDTGSLRLRVTLAAYYAI